MSTSPLSRAQRGLWFLHRLRPESAAYNLATAARVLGACSTAEIRAFFQGMVDRHAVLRTTFHREGEEPVQRVHASAEVAFAEIDARGWTEREVRAAIEDAAWRPFDLERGPVFRVALVQRAAERLLVVAMHHIVADFGSIGLFPAAAEREGKDYADFIAWQAELLAGAEGERLWGWWRDRLAGLPELDLPADRLRPDHPEAAPEQAGLATGRIGPATLAPLKALARSRRATVYVTLLAAFHALLHRLTGQEDFALGSPAAGRPKGFGRTFGYFTNPLVLRADLAGDPPFRELLDRTRQTVAEALEHQHFPLALLVERLRPGGELFRTLFVLHQGPEGLVRLVLGKDGGRLPLAGFELESVALPPRAAPFDLTLAAGELGGGLALDLVYATARLEAPTAARWLEHLGHLLAAAVAQPETPVSALPLLGAAERHQVLVELNEGGAVDLPWPTLHAGFDRQAERTPEALALIDGERRLTYRELRERAAELAERLRGMGVGPETVVGVRLPRTAELIVALLGVLKAGGAYLPLDPAYPEERIAFMVEDARAALVLADSGWEGAPSPALRGRVGEGGLAYLIYTSGSTGRPKGVAIEHAAAVRLVAWAGRAFSPAELRGVLAATSICFDLSIFEIFVPLSYGGTVILAENALAVPALPARGEITLINTVPSALAALLELGGLPPSVVTVNLAGEPLRRALADRILALGVKLWDLYGPSEDTTYSTGAVVALGDPAEPAIGAPLAGSTAYVLDRRLHPLPLGIPGELFLGGTALARGYLLRPDLTAEKFLPSPFGRPSDPSDPTDPTHPSDAFGARLYRTGDLVRRRADGALEYLGRIDHQVKIRGFRIELGEVEAALLAIAWAREAVVVAREGALVAYVAPGEGLPPQPEEALRAALRERLPAPFVPAFFVLLAALPRTPNGKVDRKALPAPGGGAEAAVSVPPAGAVEEALAALWSDLLGQGGVGRHDRFFDRGGHSLLAARVLARVRETWGTEIPLAAFFAEPTLAGLARRIEGTATQGFREAIPRAARDRPLPLSRAQQRFWLLDRLEPGQATYNVPLALHLRGPLDPAVPAGALGALVRRHEALRTTVAAEDDGTWQRIGPAPDGLPLPCVDLDVLPEDRGAVEARRIENEAARRPFDLERDLLLRAVLVRCRAADHRLVLTLHHSACDGWALGLLLAELAALWRGAALPEPGLQPADIAAWQEGEGIDEEALRTVLGRLEGAPVLALPGDRPPLPRRSSRGATLVRRLPADLAAALAGVARGREATLFMALLAGFDALLLRHTGQTDLVVGTAVAGRDRRELEGVVGCFVNTVPLRVRLQGGESFAELLDAVRAVTLEALRDQHVPFERLVEALEPGRDPARRPFPRALVVLQNQPLAPPELPGLSVEVEPIDTGRARSDLMLSFHEGADGLLTTLELGRDVFEEATVARLWDRYLQLLAAAAADPRMPLAGLLDLAESERRELIAAAETPVREEAPAGAFEAPRGALEETVAALFAEVLGRERVGRRESFFDLGGHSLLAARVVARVRGALGVEIPLPAVFDAPTVAGVAAWIQGARDRPAPLPPPEPQGEAGDAPLSFAQQRLWFLDRLEPGTATYNLPVAIRLRGPLAVPGLAAALATIVRRQGALRTTFHATEDGPVQRVAPIPPSGLWALPVEDLTALGAASEVEAFRRLEEEAVRPFDLQHGPVFRALLLRLAAEDHLLVASFHHIVSDGWSLGVLVDELSRLARGERPPELPVQAVDWARWQRRWLTGEVLEVGLRWWREALQGLPERLDLPTDRPRSASTRRRGGRSAVRLGEELSRELAACARREGVTVFTVLLAAFQALLGRRAGREDLAVGAPVAGRHHVEIEGLIGFFANTLVLRADLTGDPTGRELLRRTRTTLLAAQDHEQVPFERLVEDLAPTRDLGRTPLFEAMLAFQSAAPRPPDLPGVTAELVPVPTGTAKLDLLLDLSGQDGDLRGSLEYDADLFEAVTVERLLGQLTALLQGLAAEPAARLGDLLLLAGVERHQIVSSPAPSRPAPVAAVAYEAPQGALEEGLAALWAELLERRIGRRDDVFAAGAHSLLAAQAVARIRRAFGVEIPLRAVFEAPTVAGLAVRIAAAAGEEDPAPLAGAAEPGPAPLSFAQQRLWFLAQLDPASPVYHLPAAVRLRGRLDVAALARALAALVRRQESLRTRLPLGAGEPVQVVEEAPVLLLPVVDLRALGAAAEEEARRLTAREAVQPFDLANGPLFRVLLLRRAEAEHTLLVTLHHAIGDGWSLGVFVRELTALYAGLSLPEPAVRYRDFAVWQRARLRGAALERSLAFWRGELASLPPGLDLPTDRPRPPLQTFRGASRPIRLDAAVTGRLRDLARAEGATLFLVLLAAFQALLARWSGQGDLAVGAPVAGRTRVELEGLIGLFVNTLVLRGDLSGDPTTSALVQRTRERFLAAEAHQDLPFEKLVEELRPERNLARPVLFQVLFVLQNAPRPPLALPGLAVTTEPVDTGTAKFEIQLTLEEVDGGLAGTLDVNRDLFDTPTADRLVRHYAALLAQAGTEAGARIGDLALLSAEEAQQLREWNATAVERPAADTLPALFAAQVARTPERIAVRCAGEDLTYRQLDERASRLAGMLRRLGVGPDVVVGVCLERSLDLVVALYGIHRAGGAYLPLDPAHPTERLHRMLAEAGAPVVLTQSAWQDSFSTARVVSLDAERASLDQESAAGPPVVVRGDHLAYVIFTSGSTGAPKGAMNTHAAIANRILWMQEAYRLGAGDRVLHKTPYTFDVSVWEFFWPLLVGARLVVARPDGHRDPAYLVRTLIEEEITVLHFVPSMLQVFLGEPGVERATGVRQVMASGEALPADLARRFHVLLPGARLHNLYGPTEAAVDVTAWTCAPGAGEPSIPIGRPIANLEIRLLDRLARPVPVGAPGELCIGGTGLARGYLAQPALTADRFVPDPLAAAPGERLYRTGDLARWRPDGRLDYLGRLDHQVKIRGMRIEPGEIEAALAAFPGVREAVVLAREDRPGDRRLMAYLVGEADLPLDALRRALRESLPEPMVPASYVVLETLPVTANGKLDRRALPPPPDAPAAQVILPRTEAEELIAAAWREALGLAAVGVEDSFFDLGGHSLLVVQVHRRLVPQFPALTLVDLFRHPTISALAGSLSRETVDQISLEETRERAEDRSDRTRRQRELRRQARGR